MFVSRSGEAVDLIGGFEALKDEGGAERLRDLLFLRLHSLGLTHRKIAKVFRCDHRTIGRRLEGIPDHIKKRYCN